MKKPLILLLCILCFGTAKAQSGTAVAFGHTDSLYSAVLKENRNLWVYVPESNPLDIFTPERYPVVYLLDGDAHFEFVVSMLRQLSSPNGSEMLPKMMVVAIPNTDRMRDLSPSHVDSAPHLDENFLRTTGGGEDFLAFIEKELMPYIESKYPTAPYRTLIGHSLGGLMVMQALVHHPDMFQAYVAIDPSMWWDNQKLLNTDKTVLASGNFSGKSLYMGIANTMDEGMDIEHVAQDTAGSSLHIRSILETDQLLKSLSSTGLKYASRYYPDDTHNSAPLITEYDAFRFIFDFYPLRLKGQDYEDESGALITKINKGLALRSQQMGYEVKPPEELLNGFGYQALNRKQYALADSFFQRNIALFPESFNVYDSYGDYFVNRNDMANAIRNFEISLSKKETAPTRQKLTALLASNHPAVKLSPKALKSYVGTFQAGDFVFSTEIRGSSLWLLIGDSENELVPTGGDSFKDKNLIGYSSAFEVVAGKTVAVTLVSLDRTFRATVKE